MSGFLRALPTGPIVSRLAHLGLAGSDLILLPLLGRHSDAPVPDHQYEYIGPSVSDLLRRMSRKCVTGGNPLTWVAALSRLRCVKRVMLEPGKGLTQLPLLPGTKRIGAPLLPGTKRIDPPTPGKRIRFALVVAVSSLLACVRAGFRRRIPAPHRGIAQRPRRLPASSARALPCPR
jgi:hypothetical protein